MEDSMKFPQPLTVNTPAAPTVAELRSAVDILDRLSYYAVSETQGDIVAQAALELERTAALVEAVGGAR